MWEEPAGFTASRILDEGYGEMTDLRPVGAGPGFNIGWPRLPVAPHGTSWSNCVISTVLWADRRSVYRGTDRRGIAPRINDGYPTDHTPPNVSGGGHICKNGLRDSTWLGGVSDAAVVFATTQWTDTASGPQPDRHRRSITILPRSPVNLNGTS